MRKAIYKSDFLKNIVIILCIVALLIIWPLNLLTKEVKQINVPLTDGMSNVINYQNNASQVFIANEDHIQYVDVLVGEDTKTEDFEVYVFDTSLRLLAKSFSRSIAL